jgi:Ni/Co efflux regulator RcnB
MLKRFGLAAILFAVSVAAPLTATAQDRNHSDGQNQPAAQRQRNTGYNSGRDFRGGRDDRDDRDSRFNNHRPLPARGFDRDDFRR